MATVTCKLHGWAQLSLTGPRSLVFRASVCLFNQERGCLPAAPDHRCVSLVLDQRRQHLHCARQSKRDQIDQKEIRPWKNTALDFIGQDGCTLCLQYRNGLGSNPSPRGFWTIAVSSGSLWGRLGFGFWRFILEFNHSPFSKILWPTHYPLHKPLYSTAVTCGPHVVTGWGDVHLWTLPMSATNRRQLTRGNHNSQAVKCLALGNSQSAMDV